MKNIYILPTDKPSRLLCSKIESFYKFVLKQTLSKCNDGLLSGQRNIYITSDEEIKARNYVLGKFNMINKVKKVDKYLWFSNESNNHKHLYKKIILTTDLELIKDGVQEIDDEFLEWFVKNPSCEEIKINYEIYKEGVGLLTSDWRMSEDDKYKIIIPKEPRKIDNCYNFDKEIGCIQKDCRCEKEEPKQETLEEANFKVLGTKTDTFYNGAKWQAERMYSEEDIKQLFESIISEIEIRKQNIISNSKNMTTHLLEGGCMAFESSQDIIKEQFEQFKKK